MRRTLVSPVAVIVAVALLVSGCVVTPTPTAPTAPQPTTDRIDRSNAQANFRTAVARVEPVAEQVCRQSRQGNCDFLIRVDPNPRAPANAFQSLAPNGRPLLTFTQALIADTRNIDEIAFVIAHEAAHHIADHIARQRNNAATGAIIGTVIGAASGLDRGTADQLARAGAQVGARRYSKDFELEADALGTRIAARAGFDPVRGAAYFARIPDPGDRFLGTHPPNAQRVEIVRRTAASL
ncbi:M48 family metallopeptidase [Jannaschia sp. Os4]|uniref:M48 family metallopeptidase n=1 Tax=Jannaschia sp. Os4 TaxID=2807617 RepID=UPI001939A33B|nr:M48 family metallopeptidase [Jannaschia sp. Os4]MBM2577411.1 M48 family metallopeptidase [Jannaschia sp. Os4]